MGLTEDFVRSQRRGDAALMGAETSREQKLRAVTAVLRRIPDPAAQREVLDALFATGRKQVHHHTSRPAAYVLARTAYLEDVRAWVQAELGRTLGPGQVSDADEQAYAAATGRRFTPPPLPAKAEVA